MLNINPLFEMAQQVMQTTRRTMQTGVRKQVGQQLMNQSLKFKKPPPVKTPVMSPAPQMNPMKTGFNPVEIARKNNADKRDLLQKSANMRARMSVPSNNPSSAARKSATNTSEIIRINKTPIDATLRDVQQNVAMARQNVKIPSGHAY